MNILGQKISQETEERERERALIGNFLHLKVEKFEAFWKVSENYY